MPVTLETLYVSCRPTWIEIKWIGNGILLY